MAIDPKTGYYRLNDILGYGCKYNIILSDRGRGKSWAIKWFLLNQEGKFMCLYRQKPDMQHAMKDWIDPFVQGDDDHKPIPQELFEWKGNDQEGYELWYQGEVRGYFRYLTQVNNIKQEVFPDDTNWCWLDEFIPLKYTKLPGIESEGDAIRTVVKTIEHDSVKSREEKGLKPVRVILVANPWTWSSSLLSYFHIDAIKGYGIHRAGPGVVWEMLEPIKEKKKSRKMTVDEFLGDEVIKNQGWTDEMAFVQQIPKGAVPWLSIRLSDAFFGIYQSGHVMFAKPLKEHNDKVQMFGTLKGLTNKEACLDKSHILDLIKRWIYNGSLRYSDINCKFDFQNRINEVGRK